MKNVTRESLVNPLAVAIVGAAAGLLSYIGLGFSKLDWNVANWDNLERGTIVVVVLWASYWASSRLPK